jgi:DNA-binding beta-propeller fold protein YncE
VIVALVLLVGGCAAVPPEPGTREHAAYTIIVASEAADVVTRVRFDGARAWVESEHEVGAFASALDAPHGVAVTPDGAHYLVTFGHGRPYGSLWKIDAATDEVASRTVLGHFPASVAVTPDGTHAFVANFNLHGDHTPGSISRVHLPSMTEITRTETCVMPHGSRVSPDGSRHYSVCMMDDVVVEIDVATGGVARLFSVSPGQEGQVQARAAARHPGAHREVCAPTWVATTPDGSRLYVACSRAGEILEIEAAGWRVARRFATGASPYNVEVTPDGRWMAVTIRDRSAPALEIVDLVSGSTRVVIPTSALLPHGIAITPDSRYAFVSVEGVGSEPGRVDVVDLAAGVRIASVEIAQQATGIALLPTTAPRD